MNSDFYRLFTILPVVAIGLGFSILLLACDSKVSAPESADESSDPPLSEEASSNALPSLRLDEYEERDGTHRWILTGNRIGKLTVRLLFISNGRSMVASETVFASGNADGAGETVRISLLTKDSPPSLALSFDNLTVQSSNVDKSADLPEGLSSLASVVRKEGLGFDAQNTGFLYRSAYRSEGFEEGSWGEDLESMIAASKDGSMAFVAIALEWKPN